MKTLAASLSILTREGVMLYLLRGVAFTCIISVLGVIMGLIVGSLLALARTYCKKDEDHPTHPHGHNVRELSIPHQ